MMSPLLDLGEQKMQDVLGRGDCDTVPLPWPTNLAAHPQQRETEYPVLLGGQPEAPGSMLSAMAALGPPPGLRDLLPACSREELLTRELRALALRDNALLEPPAAAAQSCAPNWWQSPIGPKGMGNKHSANPNWLVNSLATMPGGGRCEGLASGLPRCGDDTFSSPLPASPPSLWGCGAEQQLWSSFPRRQPYLPEAAPAPKRAYLSEALHYAPQLPPGAQMPLRREQAPQQRRVELPPLAQEPHGFTALRSDEPATLPLPYGSSKTQQQQWWPQQMQQPAPNWGAAAPKARLQPMQNMISKAPHTTIQPQATTLVVRNIPRQYTQEDLLAQIGINGQWDYFHLPYNLLHKRILGYAFINFATHEMAVEFQRQWHGKPLPGSSYRKPLDVAMAESQGWKDCLARVKARKVHHLAKSGYLPIIRKDGVWLTFQQVLEELVALKATGARGSQASDEDEGSDDDDLGPPRM